MLLELFTVNPAAVALKAETDAPLVADTAKEASLTALAFIDTALEAATENAPNVVRFASTTSALVAEKDTDARLTP
jgi:hypothetical protein